MSLLLNYQHAAPGHRMIYSKLAFITAAFMLALSCE